MSKLLTAIDNQIEIFLNTLKRFPFASFSAMLLTVIFLVLSEYSYSHENLNMTLVSKIAFVATMGLVLFPALQMLGRSFIFPLLGLAGLIDYFYILPTNIEQANETIFVQHIAIFIALFLMIFWAPFIGRKSSNTLFWQYAQSLIFGLVAAIFFSWLLYGGIALAMYAIETLFHVQIDHDRYGQLGIIVFGIFGFNFFLSQIPKYPLFSETPAYSNIKRVFSKYILAPLALLYFIILFTYSAKILITLSWPESTLSWIIVAFCLVAILTFLFLTPYLQKSSKTQRLIWLAIFLQTLMLGLALWVRVEEYGITYNRYLLALFGAWLLLMSLYFIVFGKWAQQKWLFFIASVLIVASQFGPYSAYAITQQSQTERLIKLIETAHPRSEKLDLKRKFDISSTTSYIYRNFGVEAFESIIPHIYKEYQETQNTQFFPRYVTEKLGFKYLDDWGYKRLKRENSQLKSYRYNAEYSYARYQDVKGYDWVLEFYAYQKEHRETIKAQEHNISVIFKDQQISVENNRTLVSQFTLTDFTKNLISEYQHKRTLEPKKLTYQHEDANLSLKINFNNIELESDGRIEDFDAKILFKIKDK